MHEPCKQTSLHVTERLFREFTNATGSEKLINIQFLTEVSSICDFYFVSNDQLCDAVLNHSHEGRFSIYIFTHTHAVVPLSWKYLGDAMLYLPCSHLLSRLQQKLRNVRQRARRNRLNAKKISSRPRHQSCMEIRQSVHIVRLLAESADEARSHPRNNNGREQPKAFLNLLQS